MQQRGGTKKLTATKRYLVELVLADKLDGFDLVRVAQFASSQDERMHANRNNPNGFKVIRTNGLLLEPNPCRLSCTLALCKPNRPMN